MGTYILQRILRGIITLWLVITVVFFGSRLSGDPIEMMLGDTADPNAIAVMREAYGLNDPVLVQYGAFLRQLAQGDLGDSIREGRPATEMVFERLPATLRLSGITLFFTVAGGIMIGVIAALHRNSFIDRLVMMINFVAQSAPNFLIGILLILLMSLHLGWLPSVGDQTWKHYILPILTVSFGGSAALARLTRSSMLEVLNQDFVRTATAKGLRRSPIVFRHILRNALIPVITQLGLMFAGLVSGAVVIETVFAWPGMGRLLTDAVFDRDYPVLQLIVLLIAASVVVMNLITDIAYGWVDPRIRLTESS